MNGVPNLYGLILILMAVHRPSIDFDLFSLKPFLIVLAISSSRLFFQVLTSQRRVSHIHISPLALPVAIFVTVSTISAILSNNVERSVVYTSYVVVVFALHLVVYQFARTISTKITLTLLCVAGFVHGLVSLTAYALDLSGFVSNLNFIYLHIPRPGEPIEAPRMVGLNTNPILSAMNLSFYLAISFV